MTAGPLHNHAPAHQLDLPCSLEISKKSKILPFLSCRDFDDIRKGSAFMVGITVSGGSFLLAY